MVPLFYVLRKVTAQDVSYKDKFNSVLQTLRTYDQTSRISVLTFMLCYVIIRRYLTFAI
jgi:hypothetical protein